MLECSCSVVICSDIFRLLFQATYSPTLSTSKAGASTMPSNEQVRLQITA